MHLKNIEVCAASYDSRSVEVTLCSRYTLYIIKVSDYIYFEYFSNNFATTLSKESS